MPPTLYYPVFIFTIAVLCIATSAMYVCSDGNTLQLAGGRDFITPLLLCIAYAVFIGGRPLDGVFGDTISYARIYDNLNGGAVAADWHSEWAWQYAMLICKQSGLSVNGFFTIVSLGYFLTAYMAICVFTPYNVYITLLFVLSSMTFYAFGINGIRNGLACHMSLLAIALMLRGYYPFAIALFACAFGVHRSSILPIFACIAGVFFVRDIRYVIGVWLLCIPISLMFGGFFTAFFSSLGFDDRMASYTAAQDMSLFRYTGFRWDFLLYSSVPVAMSWWISVKKRIRDNWYDVLCTVYILCNAFWILVIRSAYSNRFAYLSWFMYPVIIAYPAVMLPVWKNQDKITAIILIAYVAFTILLGYLWGML